MFSYRVWKKDKALEPSILAIHYLNITLMWLAYSPIPQKHLPLPGVWGWKAASSSKSRIVKDRSWQFWLEEFITHILLCKLEITQIHRYIYQTVARKLETLKVQLCTQIVLSIKMHVANVWQVLTWLQYITNFWLVTVQSISLENYDSLISPL